MHDTDVEFRLARFSLILCRLENDVYNTDSLQKQKTALLLSKVSYRRRERCQSDLFLKAKTNCERKTNWIDE